MDNINSKKNAGEGINRKVPDRVSTASAKYRQVDPKYNIALMASAGTGKTFNLALRVVATLMQGGRSVHDFFDATGKRVVSEHVSTSHGKILCLTFTRKATAEMMNRVQDFLTQLANGQLSPTSIEYQIIAETLNITSPEHMQKMAIRARDRVYSDSSILQIKTIDSFTSLILKLFPFEANVRPDFKILNETSEEIIQRESFVAAFKELSGGVGISYEELFFKLIAWTGEQPYDFTDRLKEQIAWVLGNAVVLRSEISGASSVTVDALSEYIKRAIDNNNKIYSHLYEMLAVLKEMNVEYRATLERRFDEYMNIAKLSLSDEIFQTSTNEVITDEAKADNISATPNVYSGVAAVRYILENIKPLEPEQVVKKADLPAVPDVYRKMFKELEELLREHIKYYVEIDSKLILHIASKVSGAIEEIKARRGLLSYSDLSRIVHTMMGDNEFTLTNDYLYFRLDGRVEHILVDEFQDTSKVQWDMLRPLAEEAMSGVAQRDKVGSFFCVGDSKQTIYRFRGSSPHFFQDIINRYSSVMDKEELDTNHRSDKNIITFVNDLFIGANDFIQEQRGEDAEKVPEFEYTHQQAASKEDGYVNVKLVLGDMADDRKQRRLEILKDIIDEVVSYGWSHSDIAILVSKRSSGISVHRYLSNELDISSTLGYTEYLSAKPSYLIVEALVSYMYTRSRYNLAEFLLTPPEIINSKQILSDTVLDRYKSLLDAYLEKSEGKTVYKRIMSIGKRLSVTSRLLEDPDFTLLLNIVAHKLPTVTNPVEFLDQLSTLANETPSGGEKRGSTGISIMTIHGVKGLQFPVVIMFDVSEQFRLHNQLKYFIGESSGKLFKKMTKAYQPYMSQDYITALDTEELMDTYEKINKLYVATTRAERALFVLVESTNNNNTDKYITTRFPEGLELGVMPTKADSKPIVQQGGRDRFRELCWSLSETTLSSDSSAQYKVLNKWIKGLQQGVTDSDILARVGRYLDTKKDSGIQEIDAADVNEVEASSSGKAVSKVDEVMKVDTEAVGTEVTDTSAIDKLIADKLPEDRSTKDIPAKDIPAKELEATRDELLAHRRGAYESFESRQFGVLFHEVVYQLAKLKAGEDRELGFVDDAVNKAWCRYGGYLDDSVQRIIKSITLQLVEQPQWIDWVSEGDIYREKSNFYTGKHMIIDMYIVKEDRVIVLDFKTGSAGGSRQSEYIDQVSMYMKGLANQYNRHTIEGYLLFVSEEGLGIFKC